MKRKSLMTLMLILIVCMALVMVLASCNPGKDDSSTNEDKDVVEHVHSFGEWELVTLPTETTEGSIKRTCQCGEEETFVLPVINAENYELTVQKRPTCVSEGETAVTFSGAGFRYIFYISVPKVEHNYGEWQTVTRATCVRPGERKRTCSVCGSETREEIPALGHSYVDEVVPPNCTEQGYTKHTCSVCGDSYVDTYVPCDDTHIRIDGTNYCQCGKIMDDRCFTYELLPDDTYAITKYTGRYSCIVIPDTYNGKSVTSIGRYVFSDRSDIRQITIPESIMEIDQSAFYNCSSLVIFVRAQSMPVGWNKHWLGTIIPVVWNYKGVGENTEYKYYIHNDNTITIASYLGKDAEIVIPDQIDGMDVVGIGPNAFMNNDPFENNDNITNISMPNSVTSIGVRAFYFRKALKNIKLSDQLVSIGDYAFSYCKSLTSITLPYSVQIIEEKAFYSCDTLESIVIPCNVKKIERDAFIDCDALTIYAEVTSKPYAWAEILYKWNPDNRPVVWGYNNIVDNADYDYVVHGGEVYLTKYKGTASDVVVPSQINNMNVVSIGNMFAANSTITSVVIPESVTIIDDGAFMGCSALTSITLPDSVTSIGTSAFEKCSALVDITLPKGLTTISVDMFSYCSALQNISIPSSVTIIERSAFRNCSSLQSIILNNSVTRVGSSAFANCSALTIYAEAMSKPIGWASDWNQSNCPVVKNFKSFAKNDMYEYIIYNDDTVTITKYIGNTIMFDIGMIDRMNVVSIADNAFSDCANIEIITIPSSVVSIGKGAFRGCTSLMSLKFDAGSQLNNIGDFAFANCRSLTSINIPSGVTSIGQSMFLDCSALQSITLPDKLESIGESAFSGCRVLTSITIPEGVTSILRYTFKGCGSLMSIMIPSSVTSISSGVFDNCYALTVYAEAVSQPTGWDSSWNANNYPVVWDSKNTDVASDGCVYFVHNGMRYSLKDGIVSVVEQPTNLIENVIIPSTATYKNTEYDVTNIITHAFDSRYLFKSVTIPSTITSIEVEAFARCRELTIYVEVASKPAGWHDAWNGDYWHGGVNPVVWDYKNNDVADNSNIYILKNGIEYILKDGVATIKHQSIITDNNIRIPNEILYNGTRYKVTGIDDYAFFQCETLSSISLPNTITTIGKGAFQECSALTSITIPNSVTKIYSDAFKDCTSLNRVYITDIGAWCNILFGIQYDANRATANPLYYAHNIYINGKLVTNLEIPNGVTSIGDYAFADCSSFTSVNIPSGVTSIGECAFDGCSSLTSITIPSSVTSIGYAAFAGCSSLTSITIPDSVTSIGGGAFYRCSSLTSINIPNSVTSIGGGAFEECTSLSSITIPEGITMINKDTFNSCDALESVVLPSSLTSIGEYAFWDCSSLTSITIPSSVTSIGDGAFAGCSSLNRVDIKDLAAWCNISFGGGLANPLSYAHNLYLNGELVTNLEIPSSVTSIGSYVFDGCSLFTSVNIPSGVTSIGYRAFYNCSALTSITIPSSVTSIGGYAFSHCSSLTSITIPSSVTSIGDGAFSYCSSLTSVIIPSSVTSIGGYAFSHCSSLASINIPDGVTSIGIDAFDNCSALTSITIPSSVTVIDRSAFYGCSVLTIYAEVSSQPTGWDSDWNLDNMPVVWDCNNNDVASDGYIYVIDNGIQYALKDGAAIVKRQSTSISGDITIPDSIKYKDVVYNVTKIDYMAFLECSSLTSITIPSGVTSIGNNAFSGCSSLTSMMIPNSVTNIGNYAFSGCDSIISITLPYCLTRIGDIFDGFNSDRHTNNVPSSLKEIIVTGGTSIGDYAFSGCSSLTSITIPESITSIGNGAFSGCSSLTSITIPESITSIGNGAFSGCSSLTSITIPSSVTSIGNGAFSGCSSLTSITIPGSVTSIGYEAFTNCKVLTSINLPNGLTDIADSIFEGCSVLTSITIPDSVTSIGVRAFAGCSSLTSIIIPNSVTTIGTYAFYGCSSLTIYAEAAFELYGWNSNWNPDNRPVYWYSESEPTGTPVIGTGYWHYDTDGVTPVVWVRK